MKIRRVSYIALGAFVFAASCSKEAAEPDVFDWADGRIYIKPSIENVVGSRGSDMTLDRLESFQVSCFNNAGSSQVSAGYLSPHFENATFVRKSSNAVVTTFESAPYEEPHDWPSESGIVTFFAFHPSLSEMGGGTKLKGSSNSYALTGVRINSDISQQFDLITAKAAGERWNDFAGGVDLAFSHQLCQVELKAWGNGSIHEFEIAGVRIGNPVVEGDFMMADDLRPSCAAHWAEGDNSVKGKVEYIFQNTGDRIYRITNAEHNTAESAGSIMGRGGCAMVIPTVNSRWEGLNDPNNNNVPYTTDKMYFSILTRVVDHESGNVIYPYPDDKTGMTVVSLALDGEGRIVDTVYAGQTKGAYFSDSERKIPYVAPKGVEIKDYGWAAVPVDADWKGGKRYVYTLDYSEGIGLHNPEDPEPGKPIGGKSNITWGMSVSDWNYAEKDDNYTPDLEIPE